MAEIIENPIQEIYERFKSELSSNNIIDADLISFGDSDVGARIPWIAFKPMTNYSWLQATDLSNNECGILVNLQIEAYAKKESVALALEDASKAVLFNMGFISTGFNKRFKNNEVHRYVARYALRYTGALPNLNDN